MKPVIYQLLPRLFTNMNEDLRPNGTVTENGSGKLNDINGRVLGSLKDLGVTHVWYTGVIEHATKSDYTAYGIRRDNPRIVKGQAGSPYAIKDYYDINPDLAENVDNRMAEFEALVDRTHRAGLKVIIDFVPNHLARQYFSDQLPKGVDNPGTHDDTSLYFGRDNNFYYIPRQLFAPHIDLGTGQDAYIEFPAKASGNDCFNAFPGPNDWYDTVKLNYGVDYGDGSRHFDPVPDTWFKMLHILRFWASKGVDGFRCDMVHMVPLEFWEWAVTEVKRHHPGIIFIAEIYDVGLYRPFIDRGGFDYLYDKVNLYDTLRGIMTSNFSAATLTNSWQTVDGIGPHMLNFLENHDEQRFGSRFYAGNPALVTPSLVVSAMLSTCPMMIYMAQELGEQALDAEGFSGDDGRTTIFDYWSLATLRRWLSDIEGLTHLSDRERWLRDIYRRVLRLCNSEKAISDGAFFDLMYVNYDNPTLNPHRQFVFMRSKDNEVLLIAVNFGDYDAHLKINIPQHAFETLAIEPAANAAAVELLSETTAIRSLSPAVPFDTTVPPFGAVVWKIVTPERSRQKKAVSRRVIKAKKS